MNTILLVDDNATMRQILKLYMLGRLYTFLEAETAEAALELLQRERVDLLIVDIHLGNVDGPSFVRMLRAQDPSTCAIPVIFISADREGSSVVHDIGPPVSFMPKPLDRDRLVQLVDSHLPRKAG